MAPDRNIFDVNPNAIPTPQPASMMGLRGQVLDLPNGGELWTASKPGGLTQHAATFSPCLILVIAGADAETIRKMIKLEPARVAGLGGG